MKTDQFNFDFNPSGQIRQSKKIEDILFQLDKKSDREEKSPRHHEEIDFSKFGSVEESKSQVQKSFTSEMFNQPKQESIPESNQRPEFEFQQESSRDINEITYLYSQNQSFRFQRSISFQQPQQQDNSRFQRLKSLLAKAKSNNLEAFYRNIEQAATQNNQGNRVFQNKAQFKDFTRNLRAQKRQEQAKFQEIAQKREAEKKTKNNSLKANLFGKADDAFKKKQTGDFFLPPEYSQENEEDVDFFKMDDVKGQQPQKREQHLEVDQYTKERKDSYLKQAADFFGSDRRQNFDSIKPSSKSSKPSLEPIRQQKITPLDMSQQQKKFQQLIANYSHMKSNYSSLMDQLKQTSSGQYQLMEEMQRIKHDYSVKQSRVNSNSEEQARKKKEEKERQRKLKEEQMKMLKEEVHAIREVDGEKDVAYMKINEKIQQLEKIVRMALEEVQEEKQLHNLPKVVNYFSEPQSPHEQFGKDMTPREQLQFNAQDEPQPQNSSRSNSMYQVENEILPQDQLQRRYGSNSRPKPTQSRQNPQKPESRNHSRVKSNMQSYGTSVQRENPHLMYPQQQRSYGQAAKEPLNFIDEFSSPLQLDLSVRDDQNPNSSSMEQSSMDIPFCPGENALEFIPMALDQTETKNLRSILTQKSSILYESFEFLCTVRYTMQPEDEMYPVVGSLRLANKCAIDLLDVFVIVYGPQGQNVQVTPSKICHQRLKYNSNIFFQVKLDKTCIEDNGFNVQVCYKTDSITRKKINFKALLPIIQLIKPEFCYQQNFIDSWQLFKNQIYIRPRKLNFKHIRNHQDLKLVLPLIHISQHDPNMFSYGLMFRYPKSKSMFMLKIVCYLNGKASIHLRADKNGQQKLKEELLNVVSYLFLV